MRKIKPRNTDGAEQITALLKHGWTVEQIAYRVGASLSSIQNWRRGLTKPIKIYREKLEKLLKQEEEKRGL